MIKAIEMAGEKFGRLTVVRKAENTSTGPSQWICICECGKTVTVSANSLRTNHTKSCGCLKVETAARSKRTHGMSYSPTYASWEKMISRCGNPNNKRFHDYGERGIKVCERWMIFENFLQDMGERPSKQHSIDRIETNGNYEPDNCRWATTKEQSRNKRNTIRVEVNGRSMSIVDAAELTNIPYYTLISRLRRGWDMQDAITRPVKG